MSENMTPMQTAYARLVKIAETELCHMCGEEPITDIWHSLCTKCAISAEEYAYDSLHRKKIGDDDK